MYTHIREDLLLEMAEIGRLPGYRIMIFGSEGTIPHFHFESLSKDGKFGCIRIDKPEYFFHGKYKDKFNNKEKKNLVKFLSAPHKTFGKHGYTNWQIICIYWDDNNPDYHISTELQMPDYKLLD